MSKTSSSKCPIALREFGARLRDALNSPEGLLVAKDACMADSWTCGGCDYLAAALGKWLGDAVEPVAVLSGDHFEHAAVRIGDCFLDGDGLSTRQEFLRRWRAKRLTIEPLVVNCRREDVDEIVRFLKKRFE